MNKKLLAALAFVLFSIAILANELGYFKDKAQETTEPQIIETFTIDTNGKLTDFRSEKIKK